jgi:hypothetical protein
MRIGMRHTAVVITLALSLAVGISASSDDGGFSAEGVVVAVQKAKDEVRMADPQSMGDVVEVWMVRVDKWPRPDKPGFVLVEYTHHDALIKDGELDSTTWKFELRKPTPDKSGTCLSWWTAERSFVPTALGSRGKLPAPKTIPCFLMRKRPVPATGTTGSDTRTTR